MELSDTISIRCWVKRGVMLINTYALEPDDPDHPYQQALAQGVRPEAYGLVHPDTERFAGKTRGELIEQIRNLEKELDAWQRMM
jgi:hypothetical protein